MNLDAYKALLALALLPIVKINVQSALQESNEDKSLESDEPHPNLQT